MYVNNIHRRTLDRTVAEVAGLLDTLGSADDRLWPNEKWPAMQLERGLAVGSRGGHGPIRYAVVARRPGEYVSFQFSAPAGFNGGHHFGLSPDDEGRTVIRHTLEMNTSGSAVFTWPLLFRPLHDALIEDAFDKAEHQLGLAPRGTAWSLRVKVLRRLLRAVRFARR